MAKPSKTPAPRASAVRTRRAYFDCRFGQLHVRTAFPTTGGFDEGVTLFCLHPEDGTSRTFDPFLAEIANDRSVYAPDMPGMGESDPLSRGSAAGQEHEEAALAVADLAADLRLRQIDVLGFRFGAAVALSLAVVKPELVRRLVLIGTPPLEQLPSIKQETLVLRVKLGNGDDSHWTRGTLERPTFVELADYMADLFSAAPKTLAQQIGGFLKAK